MAENGKGVLFKNDRKKKDTHPDYTGNFVLTKDLLKAWIEEFKKGDNMTELKVDLASWIKKGQKGPFLSVSVSAPYDKPKDAPPPKRDLDDSDIPF